MTAGAYQGTITVTDPSASNTPQTITVTLTVISGGDERGALRRLRHSDQRDDGDHGGDPGHGLGAGRYRDDQGRDQAGSHATDPAGRSVPTGWSISATAIFVEGARPDVEAGYPAFPFNYRAGWGYMLLTNFLPAQGNGTYKLYAFATDKEGNQVLLGTKTITCDNAHAVKPFGTIDTPAQGGDAVGESVRQLRLGADAAAEDGAEGRIDDHGLCGQRQAGEPVHGAERVQPVPGGRGDGVSGLEQLGRAGGGVLPEHDDLRERGAHDLLDRARTTRARRTGSAAGTSTSSTPRRVRFKTAAPDQSHGSVLQLGCPR